MNPFEVASNKGKIQKGPTGNAETGKAMEKEGKRQKRKEEGKKKKSQMGDDSSLDLQFEFDAA